MQGMFWSPAPPLPVHPAEAKNVGSPRAEPGCIPQKNLLRLVVALGKTLVMEGTHCTVDRSLVYPLRKNIETNFIFIFFFFFLQPHLLQEVPRLGVEPEQQLPAYTTAIATWDPSHICNLHHSS